MTKLYHGPDGWIVPGQQDKRAERVDVPNPPAELAAWLNERHVWATSREIDRDQIGFTGEFPDLTMEELESLGADEPAAPKVPGHCDSCGRSAVGALKLQQGNELDAIEQWAETAEVWALKRLADRIAEIARGRNAALEAGQGRAN